jgi:hypothetical protein
MFSYFPCLPATTSPGFAKPTIEIPGFVNGAIKQGFKSGDALEVDVVSDLWKRTTQQVLDQGLDLGVDASTPEKRFATGQSKRENEYANR